MEDQRGVSRSSHAKKDKKDKIVLIAQAARVAHDLLDYMLYLQMSPIVVKQCNHWPGLIIFIIKGQDHESNLLLISF